MNPEEAPIAEALRIPITGAALGSDPGSWEARLRRGLVWLAVVLGPPLLLFGYFRATHAGLTDPTALDLAQVARNLLAGRGFVTEVIRPLALSHGADAMRQPEMIHGPFYPFLLALTFAVSGPREWVALAWSALFYFLTLPAIYLLGRRVFDPQVGALAAGCMAASAPVLAAATSGSHISFCIFLGCCLLLVGQRLSVACEPEAPLPGMLLAWLGVLCALLYLAEPMLFWVAPVGAGTAFALFPRRRLAALGRFALPFCALSAPWMLRNALLTGDPVFALAGKEILMQTSTYPGDQAYRTFPQDLTPGFGVLRGVAGKTIAGFGAVIEAMPGLLSAWALAFLLPSLLFRCKDRPAARFRAMALAWLGSLTVGLALYRLQIPLLLTIAPAMLVLAVGFMLHIAAQARLTRAAQFGAAVALASLAVFPLLRDLDLAGRADVSPIIRQAQAFGPHTRKTDVVLTDNPWLVAWHADSPCILLPASDRRVPELLRHFPSTRWLFLTGEVRRESRSWRSVYDGFAQGIVQREELRRAGIPIQDAVRLSATGTPLMDALDGSTWVPLGSRPSLEAIAAALPNEERSMGLNPPEPPAP